MYNVEESTSHISQTLSANLHVRTLGKKKSRLDFSSGCSISGHRILAFYGQSGLAAHPTCNILEIKKNHFIFPIENCSIFSNYSVHCNAANRWANWVSRTIRSILRIWCIRANNTNNPEILTASSDLFLVDIKIDEMRLRLLNRAKALLQ